MEKGNLLVTANGKGHGSITTWWGLMMVAAAICVSAGFMLASAYGFDVKVNLEIASYSPYTTKTTKTITKNDMYNVWIGVGVFTAALCLVMAGLVQSRVSKTVVNVYEKCVEGSSVAPKFPLAFMLYGSISSLQLVEFQLTYDKVSSVDVVNGNTVVINAGNVQHKIYAKDARKVRDEIVSRKSASGAA